MSRRRPRQTKPEPIEVDYLGSRGYPLSPHNRHVVLQIVTALSAMPERKTLFRYLDARLMPPRH